MRENSILLTLASMLSAFSICACALEVDFEDSNNRFFDADLCSMSRQEFMAVANTGQVWIPVARSGSGYDFILTPHRTMQAHRHAHEQSSPSNRDMARTDCSDRLPVRSEPSPGFAADDPATREN
jgi:hypothetical protein